MSSLVKISIYRQIGVIGLTKSKKIISYKHFLPIEGENVQWSFVNISIDIVLYA